ncbi:unnamed protein product [Victoria cruziana]
MAMAYVQGRKLEVTVLGWRGTSAKNRCGRRFYATVGYGSKGWRTKTCRGGRTSATFDDRFEFELIEGLHDVDVAVWKKKFLGRDRLIAFRKIGLEDHILGGWKSKKMWELHHQPRRGAHINNVGELYLEISCPIIQPHGFPPPSSVPYGYPAHYGDSSHPAEKQRPPGY